jgi:ribosome assembly protein 4
MAIIKEEIKGTHIICEIKSSNLKLTDYDVESKKLKEDLPGHADEVFAVDWSADGRAVVSGGRDRIVKIWKH